MPILSPLASIAFLYLYMMQSYKVASGKYYLNPQFFNQVFVDHQGIIAKVMIDTLPCAIIFRSGLSFILFAASLTDFAQDTNNFQRHKIMTASNNTSINHSENSLRVFASDGILLTHMSLMSSQG